MKKLIALSVLTGTLAFTGCTTMQSLIGMDDTGTHDTHATVNGKAPVSSMNGILVDAQNKMTLYTYDKDSMNTSNCNGACLVAWPAFEAPMAADPQGAFSTIERSDGTYQWAVNGMPLYFYANDLNPGDMRGDEKMDVWHVVKTK